MKRSSSSCKPSWARCNPSDVRVECVVTRDDGESRTFSAVEVRAEPPIIERAFRLEFAPPFAGQQTYQIRMYPHHDLLSHPFEMGRMLWI